MTCYNCRDFGARGDGQQDDTQAIQNAIRHCAAQGGGRVFVPAGLYMIGMIELLENVELYLDFGSTLRGIYQSSNYRSVHPDLSTTALVFAQNCRNVAIHGGGTLDAQGDRYWRKLDGPRSKRKDVLEVGVSQFWYEHIKDVPRPDRVVVFYRCRNVSIAGIQIVNSAAWTCHLIASERITIRGITIDNHIHGPNTDGIDIDGSSDVLISDCLIQAGDDAIVLKTKHTGGVRSPIRNVTVTNCRLTSGCNAFKIGTETMEDVENICFSNSTVYNPDESPLIDRCITGIALETVDGGNVRNVVCSNISMINARTAVFLRRGARLKGERKTPGCLRNILLSNIVATGTTYPSVCSGLPDAPIEDVRLDGILIESRGGFSAREEKDVPEHPADYPEVFMFGQAPAGGLYMRHMDRVEVRGLHLRSQQPSALPEIVLEDVQRHSTPPEQFPN